MLSANQGRLLPGGILDEDVFVLTPEGPVALSAHPDHATIAKLMEEAKWTKRVDRPRHVTKKLFSPTEVAFIEAAPGTTLAVIRKIA